MGSWKKPTGEAFSKGLSYRKGRPVRSSWSPCASLGSTSRTNLDELVHHIQAYGKNLVAGLPSIDLKCSGKWQRYAIGRCYYHADFVDPFGVNVWNGNIKDGLLTIG